MVRLFTKIATKLQQLSIPVTMLPGKPCKENYLSDDKGRLIEIILSAMSGEFFILSASRKRLNTSFIPTRILQQIQAGRNADRILGILPQNDSRKIQ
jgi:hypothetical protein